MGAVAGEISIPCDVYQSTMEAVAREVSIPVAGEVSIPFEVCQSNRVGKYTTVFKFDQAVLLAFRLCCFTLCCLDSLCSFPIWCLG